MREFCSTVRGTQNSGAFNDNINPASSLGIIKACADMTSISLEKIDRELRKGTFILFVKKTALCRIHPHR